MILVIAFALVASAAGKTYERCELARELRYAYDVPESEVAVWVCIAEHESQYNTSAVGMANGDGSSDHGIFQISDIFWCSPPGKGWACGVTCAELEDDDIEDDFTCAEKIHKEHEALSGDGFNAWAVYQPFCKSNDTVRYVEGCFGEDDEPVTPHPKKKKKVTKKVYPWLRPRPSTTYSPSTEETATLPSPVRTCSNSIDGTRIANAVASKLSFPLDRKTNTQAFSRSFIPTSTFLTSAPVPSASPQPMITFRTGIPSTIGFPHVPRVNALFSSVTPTFISSTTVPASPFTGSSNRFASVHTSVPKITFASAPSIFDQKVRTDVKRESRFIVNGRVWLR